MICLRKIITQLNYNKKINKINQIFFINFKVIPVNLN